MERDLEVKFVHWSIASDFLSSISPQSLISVSLASIFYVSSALRIMFLFGGISFIWALKYSFMEVLQVFGAEIFALLSQEYTQSILQILSSWTWKLGALSVSPTTYFFWLISFFSLLSEYSMTWKCFYVLGALMIYTPPHFCFESLEKLMTS